LPVKAEMSLKAERIAAQHCAELVRAAPGTDELAAMLGAGGERLARALVPALAPLAGGKGLTCKAKAARRSDLDDLTMFNPDLMAHLLLGFGGHDGGDRLPLLALLDAAAVLRMVDRTFGGRGEAPSPLPDEFPLSAELLIGRLEELLVRHLAAALGLDPAAITGLARSGSLNALDPFPRNDPVVALEIDVTEPAGDTWQVTLAVPLPTLAALFGGAPRKPSAAPRRAVADPLAQPFGDLPLTLRAVLVDMNMPMAALAALEVGQVLPVAVARAVPLRLGTVTVATGSVGAADDRVALQINTAF
jgi:flagellar motor switch protein FliM